MVLNFSCNRADCFPIVEGNFRNCFVFVATREMVRVNQSTIWFSLWAMTSMSDKAANQTPTNSPEAVQQRIPRNPAEDAEIEAQIALWIRKMLLSAHHTNQYISHISCWSTAVTECASTQQPSTPGQLYPPRTVMAANNLPEGQWPTTTRSDATSQSG